MVSGRFLLWVLVVLLLLCAPFLLIHWLTSDADVSFEEEMSPPVVHERSVKKREISPPEEFEEVKTEELAAPQPEREEPKESMDLVPAVRSAGILPPRVSGHLLPAVPGQPVKTELKMRVLGTLAINDGTDSRSSALIAMGGGKSRTYFPGQEIGDGANVKLVRVGQDRVEFLNHERLEFATLSRSSAGGSSSLPVSDRASAREARRNLRGDQSDSTEDQIVTPDTPANDQEERSPPPPQEENSEE